MRTVFVLYLVLITVGITYSLVLGFMGA